MANQALSDQKQRKIEVETLELLKTLKLNKQKHIKEYEEALEGYKEQANSKIHEAYGKAKAELEKGIKRAYNYVADFDVENPQDYFQIVKGINLELKVPRNYANKYDAAIDMVAWDVRKTLELTQAEFQCFVRDVWEWTAEFENVSAIYKNIK